MEFCLFAFLEYLAINEGIDRALPYLFELLPPAALVLAEVHTLIFVVEGRALSTHEDQLPVSERILWVESGV